MPLLRSRTRGHVDFAQSPTGLLQDIDINASPEGLRVARSRIGKARAAARSSEQARTYTPQYSPSNGSRALTSSPAVKHTNAFLSDKRVTLRKDEGPHGITLGTQNGQVVVCGLDGDSQARNAGLLVGDVIFAVNEERVTNHADALRAIDAAVARIEQAAFGVVELDVGGGTKRVFFDKSRGGKVGLTLRNAQHTRGVLVQSMGPNSLARGAGLLVGETIVAVNGQLVGEHLDAVSLIDRSDEVELVVSGEAAATTLAEGGELGVTFCDQECADDGAGVKLLHVEHGGAISAAGLTVGDTLLSIGGVLCVRHSQAMRQLEAAHASGQVQLVYQSKYARGI